MLKTIIPSIFLISLGYNLPAFATQGSNISGSASGCALTGYNYKEAPNCAERAGLGKGKSFEEQINGAWSQSAGIFKNDTAKKEAYKKAVKAAYDDYKKDFNCENPKIVVRPMWYTATTGSNSKFSTEAAAKNATPPAQDPTYKKYPNMSPSVEFPSTNTSQLTNEPANSIRPPCSTSMDDAFEMNSTELRSNQETKGLKAKVQKCIDDAKADGFEVSQIKIKTSANALANTGTAASTYGTHNFMGLSKARSDSLMDFMDNNFPNQNFSYQTDYKGKNGDGSSGPCPYKKKEGCQGTGSECYQLKKGLEDTRSELEQYKYATIQAQFAPKQLPNQIAWQNLYKGAQTSFSCER